MEFPAGAKHSIPGGMFGVQGSSVAAQTMQFNGQGGIFPLADPVNPILIAEISWTTADFMPRTVDVAISELTYFFVYTGQPGGVSVSIPPAQVGLFATTITVSPCPASLGVFAPALVLAAHRRR